MNLKGLIKISDSKSFKEKFFTCEGRLNRKPFILRIVVIWILTMIIQEIIGAVIDPETSPFAFLGVYLVLSMPILVSSIMITIRRLHDTEHSGWWWLAMMIPIVNLYVIYLTYFKKGTAGYNHYGADPIVDGKGEDII